MKAHYKEWTVEGTPMEIWDLIKLMEPKVTVNPIQYPNSIGPRPNWTLPQPYANVKWSQVTTT